MSIIKPKLLLRFITLTVPIDQTLWFCLHFDSVVGDGIHVHSYWGVNEYVRCAIEENTLNFPLRTLGEVEDQDLPSPIEQRTDSVKVRSRDCWRVYCILWHLKLTIPCTSVYYICLHNIMCVCVHCQVFLFTHTHTHSPLPYGPFNLRLAMMSLGLVFSTRRTANTSRTNGTPHPSSSSPSPLDVYWWLWFSLSYIWVSYQTGTTGTREIRNNWVLIRWMFPFPTSCHCLIELFHQAHCHFNWSTSSYST